MKNNILFIFILSIILFLVITIIRVVMTITIKYVSKNIFYKFKKYNIKSEDLVKDRQNEIEQEQNNELKNVVKINQKENREEIDYTSHIVGIVEPKGYWTSLIMGQKIKNMLRNLDKINEQNNKGYHNTMRFSKDKSKGKDRGI